MNFRKRKLLFMDFEMTGLDPVEHEIIEVACLVVRWEDFKITKKYYSKVKPLRIKTATEEALRISGYNKKDWEKAPHPKAVLNDIVRLSKNAIPAGWSIHSDWAFLKQGLKKYKIENSFDYHIFEVSSLAYMKLLDEQDVKQISLRKVSKHLNIEMPKEHDAMSDIIGTYNVFKKLIDY